MSGAHDDLEKMALRPASGKTFAAPAPRVHPTLTALARLLAWQAARKARAADAPEEDPHDDDRS